MMTERKRLLLAAGIALCVGYTLGTLSMIGGRTILLWVQREPREQFAVKAVNPGLPLEILDVIEEQDSFSVPEVLALIDVESSGRAKKVSPKGAVGLMQLMPVHANKAGLAVDDLYDPAVNVRLGLRHPAWLRKKYKRNEYHYISAYNDGHDDWDQVLDGKRAIPSETANHWRKYQKARRKYEDWIERGIWEE